MPQIAGGAGAGMVELALPDSANATDFLGPAGYTCTMHKGVRD